MAQNNDDTEDAAGTAPEREPNDPPSEPNPYSQLTLPPNPYSSPPQYEYGPMPYETDPYAPVPREPDPYGYPAWNPYSQNSPPSPHPLAPPRAAYPQARPAGSSAASGGYPARGGQPPPPQRHKRSAVPWVAGAVAFGLLFAGGIVGISLGSAAHAPELQVQAYLDALAGGDAEEALALTRTEVGQADLLLTNEAYRNAGDRITRYTIRDSTVDGDSASVTAMLTQGGASYDHEFTLTRTGREAVLFDAWTLDTPADSVVSVDVAAPDDTVVEVAGVDVSTAGRDGTVELRALPGTYAVALAGDTTWYDATPTSASVIGFGASAEPARQLVIELTDEGTRSATDAVNAWLDDCIAATELEPTGCPFSAVNSGDYELSNLVWTVSRPVFTIGNFADGSWPVLTETEGEAVATADALDRSTGRSGPIFTDPFSFDIGGVIEEFRETGATFVPAE